MFWREDVERNKRAWDGPWAADQPAQRQPVFEFEQVRELHRVALEGDAAWSHWFAARGLSPFELAYEDLTRELLRDLLTFLGLPPQTEAVVGPPPRLRKQADDLSAEWARRYRELAGLPAAGL